MDRILSRTILSSAILLTMLTAQTSSAATNTPIIYSIDNAQHFQGQPDQKVYIQAESFLNESNAVQYQNSLQAKIAYPVNIVHRTKFYSVMIGPLSAAEAKSISKMMLTVKETDPKNNNPYKGSVDKVNNQQYFSVSDWFAAIDAGVGFPQFKSNMYVDNGSGAPAPYNEDMYSTNKITQPVIGFTLGHRWTRENEWLPAVFVGLRYQYLSKIDVGNKVTQYSDPDFTNYSYNLGVNSNVVLAFAKADLFQYAMISPYIDGGLGVAFNTMNAYTENALTGVTPRTSPGFSGMTTSHFAYSAGLGLDVKLSKQFILSAGYEYLNVGDVTSGKGTDAWSSQTLSLGTYHTNQILLSMTYLFGS